MTQAQNVAIESSQINSSGVLLTTGGGTGLSTVGTNGQVLTSNGTTLSWVTPTAVAPGGSNTQVQYNKAGAFGGSANLTCDNTNSRLGIGGGGTLYAPLDFGGGVGSAGAINKINLFTGSSNAQYGFGISSTQLNYITGPSANHVWFVGGSSASEIMRLDSGGKLGIGTNSPDQLLTVSGTSNPCIAIHNTTGTTVTPYMYADTGNVYMGSQSGHPLWLNTANTARVQIDITGRVGFGNQSPLVGQLDINRGTTGIRQPNSYGTAINFAGGRSTGGSAATGTMLTVNFSAVTYFAATLHVFSTAYTLNGGGPNSGMVGAYDIINIISEAGGSTYNITRVSGPALTYGSAATWTVTGGIASKIFTLTGTIGSAGQSGFLFTGYMVYGGQGPSPTNIILTSYDMATTQVWGA